MSTTAEAVVLLVEDEPDVAETYRRWLDDRYDVHHAPDGQRALDRLDSLGGAVDVVLLDRMMPGMSGEEVLAEIRDRGFECRVAMVTAVDPDFDILEMGFDEYVQKPPTRETLVETIEDLLDRSDYAAQLREYYALLAKRSALESEKPSDALASTPEYERLERDIDELEAELEGDQTDLLDDATFVGAIRDIAGERGETDE